MTSKTSIFEVSFSRDSKMHKCFLSLCFLHTKSPAKAVGLFVFLGGKSFCGGKMAANAF